MLDDLAALGPFFAVGSHPPGQAPVLPWRPVSELTTPSQALRDRIGAVRATLVAQRGLAADGIEPRVAASAVHLGLAARLTAPALGAAVLRLPVDLRPGRLWWQDRSGGPVPVSVPLPAVPGERPVGGPRGEPAALADDWGLLLDELLAPMTAAIARLAPVSDRVLRGNVASAVNTAAAQVARQRPDLAQDAWQVARVLFAEPWLRGEPAPPGPEFRRSSCCLFYRLALSYRQAQRDPSAVCGDCVLGARRGR